MLFSEFWGGIKESIHSVILMKTYEYTLLFNRKDKPRYFRKRILANNPHEICCLVSTRLFLYKLGKLLFDQAQSFINAKIHSQSLKQQPAFSWKRKGKFKFLNHILYTIFHNFSKGGDDSQNIC